MRAIFSLLIGGAVIASAVSARAQEIDWQKVDAAFGRKSAVVVGAVHRYGFPRTDLTVTIDGVTIRPALALVGAGEEACGLEDDEEVFVFINDAEGHAGGVAPRDAREGRLGLGRAT